MFANMNTYVRALINDESGDGWVDKALIAGFGGAFGGLAIYGGTTIAPTAGANLVTGVTSAQGAVTYADAGTVKNSDVDAGTANADDLSNSGTFTAP